jgi:hypothetical protein
MAIDRLTNAYAGTGYTPHVFVNDDGTYGISAEFLNAVLKVLGSGPGALALDADKVSACGIGVAVNSINQDLDTLTLGGMWYILYGVGYHFPPGDTGDALIFVNSGGTTNRAQLFFSRQYPGYVWSRTCLDGTYSTWSLLTDGLNGGRPPAPKPQRATNSPGFHTKLEITGNGSAVYYANGTTSPGGTELWDYIWSEYTAAGAIAYFDVGPYVGSVAIRTPANGNNVKASFWRQS